MLPRAVEAAAVVVVLVVATSEDTLWPWLMPRKLLN